MATQHEGILQRILLYLPCVSFPLQRQEAEFPRGHENGRPPGRKTKDRHLKIRIVSSDRQGSQQLTWCCSAPLSWASVVRDWGAHRPWLLATHLLGPSSSFFRCKGQRFVGVSPVYVYKTVSLYKEKLSQKVVITHLYNKVLQFGEGKW